MKFLFRPLDAGDQFGGKGMDAPDGRLQYLQIFAPAPVRNIGEGVVCTHPDGHNHSGNIHVHIVINSLRIAEVERKPYMDRASDTRAGDKHRCTAAAMRYFRSEVMEMCYREGLYQIDLLNGSRNKVTEREYWAKRKGQVKLDKENAALLAEGKMLKAIHAQESKKAAREKAKAVVEELRSMKLKEAAKKVESGIEETLTYCDFPSEHWTRIRTNNVIERLNREIRRRTRVVGSFPDGNSALMLVCARLRHVAGTQWGNKKYMNMKHLEAAVDDTSIAG